MNKYMKKLGKLVRVTQLLTRGGNDAVNQFRIAFENGEVIQSYRSIVVVRVGKEYTLGCDWDYSNTTVKYVTDILGMGAAQVRKDIKSGLIKYDAGLI